MKINEQLNCIAQALYDKKGFNIMAMDVRGLTSLADYFIIAEGNVARHIQSLSREIYTALAEAGEKPIHTEGVELGEWIVMDYGDVMIHLFAPGLREVYDLEGLWSQGKVVNLDIQVAS